MRIHKKVSEYEQVMPQSHTVVNPRYSEEEAKNDNSHRNTLLVYDLQFPVNDKL